MFALLGWNTGVGQRMVDSNTRRRRVESSARVEREESRGRCRDEQKVPERIVHDEASVERKVRVVTSCSACLVREENRMIEG